VPSIVLTARDVVRATPRTRIIRLALGEKAFPFLAGQAVLAGLPGGSLHKPYSIASSPGHAVREGALELLVQIEESDAADPHLERVRPGNDVAVTGPIGSFILPNPLSERDLLFVAGGTGIAPLRSMLWDAFERQLADRVGVIYSARGADEFVYAGELRELAANGRIELYLTATRVVPSTWDGLSGRIDGSLIARALHTQETHCFVCGPPGLIAHVADLLRDAGVEERRILTERY
jgi:NAD(P)H-flavin reductase